jgi:hypothetical protein
LKDRIKGQRKPKIIAIKNNLFEEGQYHAWEFGQNKFLLWFIKDESF